ncbi:hypothetical protein BSFP_067060 [Burkholderia stabilis]|uniref:Uncharacterized protein n=1 Tax=Burkholderia stabilis TaxID=95485 RepID=A0A1Y1BUZ7_9BURK|nr:hypothetical protein BSFP_067060 [Burkholderia stabilis]
MDFTGRPSPDREPAATGGPARRMHVVRGA